MTKHTYSVIYAVSLICSFVLYGTHVIHFYNDVSSLLFMRSFVTTHFGTAENAFNAMDKAKSNSGRLSERDFLEECQKLLG